MSAFAAQFFTVIQSAGFYRAVHSEAVRLLPPGNGRRWVDVGCGPGLVARLAHARGYDVIGIDRDRQMIAQARRLAGENEALRFEHGTLENLRAGFARFDVVSAASLLHVMSDRRAALQLLLEIVAPAGTLLVVETSRSMAEGTWTEAARRAAGQSISAIACEQGLFAHLLRLTPCRAGLLLLGPLIVQPLHRSLKLTPTCIRRPCTVALP